MTETLALPPFIEHAGAVIVDRDGHAVAAHYGSAAGELATCACRVGLALRSDLATLSIAGTSRSLDVLARRTLGQGLLAGGAAFDSGAWWCRSVDADELLVICGHGAAARIARSLRHEVNRFANAFVEDRSQERIVLNLLGPHATRVLADLGALGCRGEFDDVPPFALSAVHGHPVGWLIEAGQAALGVVDADRAAAVWEAIEQAGRAYGITCVGLESVERYLLRERTRRGLKLL